MTTEREKSHQIEELLTNYWQNFKDWQHNTGVQNTLIVPEEVSNVFIPRRLLELSQDPTHMRVKLLESGKSSVDYIDTSLRFLLLEQLTQPLSDPEVWQEYLAGEINPQIIDGERPWLKTQIIPGIDPEHLAYKEFIQKEELSLNDKIFIDYSVDTFKGNPLVAHTRNLFDRPDMHGMGIGRSFYERLEDILRSLGFRYLSGDINSPHPGFFEKTRIPFENLSQEEKNDLGPIVANTARRGNVLVKRLSQF